MDEKNKLIVAFKNRSSIDNFFTLPPAITVEVEGKPVSVVFHDSPSTFEHADGVIRNYNLLIEAVNITSESIDSTVEAIETSNYLPLMRYDKLTQARKLRSSKQKNKFTWLLTPGIYHTNSKTDTIKFFNNTTPLEPDNKYVIKPANGARAIGIVEIYGKSFNEFLKIIKTLSTEECIEKLSKVAISHNLTPEGHKYLNEDFFIMDKVEDIRSEYRVLVSNHKVVNVQERNRVKSEHGFEYACGSFPAPGRFSEQELKQLNSLFRDIDLDFGSVDVYRTGDGMLGIFEYCNQFGIDSYQHSLIQQIHTEFIVSVLRRKKFI